MIQSAAAVSRVSPRIGRQASGRLICLATVLACLPYLALKMAWIGGSRVGGATAMMSSPTMVVANAGTVLLDLAVVALAVILVLPGGRRLPAPLVIVPIWVGAGLLGPIALGVPAGWLIQLVVGGSALPPDAGLDNWVFAMVYGGFTVQAVLLGWAFLRYARVRWPELDGPLAPGESGRFQRLLVGGGTALAVGVGALYLSWAATRGLPGGDPTLVETAAQRTVFAVRGLVMIAGAVASCQLVWRHARRGRWLTLAAAWVGTGSLFASGLFGGPATTLGRVVDVVAVTSGLLLAIAAALLLIETRNSTAFQEV